MQASRVITDQDFFQDLLGKALQEELTAGEHFNYLCITFQYAKALACAKAGQQHMASFYLTRGDQLYEQVDSPELGLWVQLFSLPKKAFFYFRSKDYSEAGRLTREAISACAELEKKGHVFLFQSKVQQIFNLSRVEVSTGNVQQGLQLCADCLASLCVEDKAGNAFALDELTIRNIYQIILKTLPAILRVSFDCKVTIGKHLHCLFGQILDLPSPKANSADARYQEIMMFIGLFRHWIAGDYVTFKQEASAARQERIQERQVLTTLDTYLVVLGKSC